MNVLSLFDGISCGQIALNRAGIKYDKYFASEIDKNAIKVTQTNYPNTIQLGDVTKLCTKDLSNIDLLIGGSPCQGFSFAGKQLNFNDTRSKLFFEYIRILDEIKKENPDVKFLLENVKMKKEYQDIISNILNIRPLLINSANYSGQSRERLYWTNIKVNLAGRPNNTIINDILDKEIHQELEIKTNLIYIESPKNNSILKQIGYYKADKQGWRVYDTHGKSPTLISESGGLAGPGNALIFSKGKIRKMSVNEIQRLQTLPIGYTDKISRSKQHKLIGNAWTVNVIKKIFKNIK